MTGAGLINPTAMEAGLIAAAKARAMSPARAAAFEAFAKTGLPHRRMEAWKWTDLRASLRDDISSAAPAREVIAPSVFAGVGAFEITVMNGAAEWSGAPPQGVAIERRTDKSAGSEAAGHPLGALAGALADEVIEISVADDAAPEHPVLVRRIAGGGQINQRLSISLGVRAKATVIESFDGAGAYFSNCLSDYRLADGAELHRLVLQNGSDEGVDASLCQGVLAAGARFEQTALLLGARIARVETRLALDGKDARAGLASASLLSRARHADLTTHIAHNAPGCSVRQRHKAALKDAARGVFQGKFLVGRGAQNTDANMQANALLLSDKAEANHKPELEIYADDVECAHGSTAGALDEAALFYMRQRGLDEAAARALLIEAFVGEVFDDMPHPAVEHIFRQRMGRWLELSI